MVKLIDNWVLDSDQYSFVLGQYSEKPDKNGVMTKSLSKCTYHSDIKSALNCLFNIKQKELVYDNNDTMSLSVAIDKLNDLQKQFEKLLDKTIKDTL